MFVLGTIAIVCLYVLSTCIFFLSIAATNGPFMDAKQYHHFISPPSGVAAAENDRTWAVGHVWDASDWSEKVFDGSAIELLFQRTGHKVDEGKTTVVRKMAPARTVVGDGAGDDTHGREFRFPGDPQNKDFFNFMAVAKTTRGVDIKATVRKGIPHAWRAQAFYDARSDSFILRGSRAAKGMQKPMWGYDWVGSLWVAGSNLGAGCVHASTS